jgi:hypothetical protein
MHRIYRKLFSIVGSSQEEVREKSIAQDRDTGSLWRLDLCNDHGLELLEKSIQMDLGIGALLIFNSSGIAVETQMTRRMCGGSIMENIVARTKIYTTPVTEIPKWIWVMTQLCTGMTSKVTFEGHICPFSSSLKIPASFVVQTHVVNMTRWFSAWAQPSNMLELGEWIDAPMDTYGDKAVSNHPALEKG